MIKQHATINFLLHTAFDNDTVIQKDDGDSASMIAIIVLAVVLGLVLFIMLIGAVIFYIKIKKRLELY